ncbi:MAG TPA: glycosyltransferase [Thermoanaerobaculia bacterium]|jgi:GT2 family glycosyltransferase|nr:glycosyltransferase [Thermoanaerobaculia bacterium]
MSSIPTISCVIPVLDDAARLRRCLASITRSEYPRQCLEVIVVDNGSRDGSDRVALAAGARLLTCPGLRVAGLRNRGAATATGEVLAFIDADHEIDPGWMACAIDDLSQPAVGAVGAPYLVPEVATWVQRTFDSMRHQRAGCFETEWLASGNLAVWHEEFKRLHGFDEGLETCEDYDLCQRLRAGGLRLLSDDRLKSVHYGDPATLRELFRTQLWHGRDNLRAGLRGPLTLRGLPSLLIPVIELGWLAAGVGGLLAAPAGLPLAASASFGIGAFAALRAYLMTSHQPGARPIDVLQAFLVACVYDLARALALVYRASHPRSGNDASGIQTA